VTDDTGRIWFDNDGSLHSEGPVPLTAYLDELSKQLGLFLAKLESCARAASGAYVFRDARAGRLRGIEVVWARVWMLAAAASSSLVPELRLGHLRALRANGVKVIGPATPPRQDLPLSDVLGQILWSVLHNQGRFPQSLDAPSVEKLRRLAEELELHRGHLGEPNRSPALSSRAREALEIKAWKPPPGFIGAKSITADNQVPPSTLSYWVKRDNPQVHVDPRTSERHYPRAWLAGCLTRYQRGKTIPKCRRPSN